MEQIKNNIEEETDDIFAHRTSIPLTPENSEFSQSEGGLISMRLTTDGKVEEFERVVVVRAFPITNPDEFISIRLPDSRKKGRGDEIGLIENIHDFDEKIVELLSDELRRRYFIPEITKIYSMKEKYGYFYTDVMTSAGRITFVLSNPSNNFRTLEDGRILITDTDGNCFCIHDPKKLDKASYRTIEIYL